MDDFISERPENMTGADFECSCGLRHKVDIDKIIIGSGVLARIPDIAGKYAGNGVIYVISDSNTYGVAGHIVTELLEKGGFRCRSFVFGTHGIQLNPDERSLGRLIYEIEPDVSFIIGVGSGVINDLCRTISYKLKVPFMIAGTAPSMDGYASRTTPLIIDMFKLSRTDAYPKAILCDTDIMRNAPMIMIQAGFGDIIGKITALADWDLSRILTGEHYCGICAGLMENAVKKCAENCNAIAQRDEDAVRYLIEALVTAGIAMGIYTSTRPASSTEHYFAHFWDTAAISAGNPHPLHGNSVGVGTVITCDAYEYMKEHLPAGFEYPGTERVTSLLERLGAAVSPKELGISRKLFAESVEHCIDNRPKFGILHLAREKKIISDLSCFLTEKYY